VSKRLTAPYRSRPSLGDWIKVKSPDSPRCGGCERECGDEGSHLAPADGARQDSPAAGIGDDTARYLPDRSLPTAPEIDIAAEIGARLRRHPLLR
jgi:hypothetical protein